MEGAALETQPGTFKTNTLEGSGRAPIIINHLITK
jgi:hypothetical protein